MIELRIEESTAAPTLAANQKQRLDFLRCLFDKTHGSAAAPIYIEEIVKALHLEEEEAETTIRSLAEADLIKVRLQCIVSLTQAGIDEVNAALDQPSQPPAPVSTELQPAETETLGPRLLGFVGGAAAPVSRPADLQPLPARFVDASKNTEELAALELRHICEAIGLNPEEFTNERAVWDAFDAERKTTGSLQEPAGTARAEMSFFQANDLPDILASLKLRLLKVRLAADDMAEAEAEIATAIAQLLSPRPKLQIIAASLKTLLSILEKVGTEALTSDIEMSLTRIRFFLTQLPV
jgi:hypothetical protein